MVIYLFSQILKFTKYSIKYSEKFSRRHFINSSDVFVIKGFTVGELVLFIILNEMLEFLVTQVRLAAFIANYFFIIFHFIEGGTFVSLICICLHLK